MGSLGIKYRQWVRRYHPRWGWGGTATGRYRRQPLQLKVIKRLFRVERSEGKVAPEDLTGGRWMLQQMEWSFPRIIHTILEALTAQKPKSITDNFEIRFREANVGRSYVSNVLQGGRTRKYHGQEAVWNCEAARGEGGRGVPMWVVVGGAWGLQRWPTFQHNIPREQVTHFLSCK